MSQSSGLVLWKTSGPAAALDSEERQLAEVFQTPDACRLTPRVRGNSKPPPQVPTNGRGDCSSCAFLIHK